jgi:hypothetical protein
MTNETFEFSPRVSLILANLKTVREVRKVLEEEGKAEIKRFLKHIRDNLRGRVPDIQPWELVIKNNSIFVYPSDQWKVLDDDYIAISIDFSFGMKPLEGDPWVGLYVPRTWPQGKMFNEKLNKALPKGFMNEWDEPEDEWPIWGWVKYENYAKGDSFDINGFLQDVAELISKLVRIKGTIDSILNQIQRGSK